jgi:hypothetical protein
MATITPNNPRSGRIITIDAPNQIWNQYVDIVRFSVSDGSTQEAVAVRDPVHFSKLTVAVPHVTQVQGAGVFLHMRVGTIVIHPGGSAEYTPHHPHHHHPKPWE